MGVLDWAAEGVYYHFKASQYRGIFIRGGFTGLKLYLDEKERIRMLAKFRYLKQKKLIERRKNYDHAEIVLTRLGREKVLEFRVKNAPKRADGNETYAIFDIPESRRKVRRRLRSFLKRCGFRIIQMSVWSTDKDVAPLLADWLQDEKVSKWVKLIIARPA